MRRLLFAVLLILVFVFSAGAGDSSTPAARIVFSAATVFDQGRYEWQIFSALPSGARVEQLTFGPDPATDPLPSPDGRLIVFTRGKALWVMRADGGSWTSGRASWPTRETCPRTRLTEAKALLTSMRHYERVLAPIRSLCIDWRESKEP